MNKIDIFITCIVLLYRENIINEKEVYNSNDLIKSVLAIGKKKDLGVLEGDVMSPENDLPLLINRMLNTPEAYTDKTSLLGELKLLFRGNEIYYGSARDQIDVEMTDGGLKRSVSSLRNKLYKYYQGTKALNIINKLSYNLNTGKIEKSLQDDIMAVLPELETLCTKGIGKDPGLMGELILSSVDDIDEVLDTIKAEASEGGVMQTGWKQLNKMLQGGFLRGEQAIVCALQHNYKSGFTQSLVMQLARYNKPYMLDKTKKPAIMYISLEDELPNVLRFMYRYLYYNENKKLPENTEDDLSLKSGEEIKEYVMSRLGINGYEVILLRADPALWTYQDIISIVNKYIANGYEIHALVIDYLAKLPTTGCDNSIIGNGLRDMFNRIRNFGSKLRITTISPVQLSVDAKIMMRNGMQESLFVKELPGKGYFEGSKQIDQVVDLELYIHVARINKKPYLTVQRGKHRGRPILDDKYKYFTLPFPPQAPLLENLNDDSNGEDGFGDKDIEEELFAM